MGHSRVRVPAAADPDNISLPAAATVPDNLITAYFALFDCLSLPIPSSLPAAVPPAESDEAFLIYGAGATVGHYLIQLLHLAGYHQIIATASPKHHAYLRSLGAKHVFDYSDKDLSSKVLYVNNGKPIKYAVDCITAETTLKQVAGVVGQGSVVSMMLPLKEGST
ncbi:MAG TPA: zinc-binding dehydrogenase, partial [Chlamydiales bacterium]|nr:zinc-binding dehydrogenase [Chlamydiales bacterium]